MRIYINQEEKNFLINILLEHIEDFLSDQQFAEESESGELEENEVVNSLLKKLSSKEKRRNLKIRYVYEKIQ
ncbi:MAG: hypothetical protein KA007_00365 [Candidatus Pacebacteria bacterium]|nr:hypothetical protein [Candidatus Paceibacterota bacterium]